MGSGLSSAVWMDLVSSQQCLPITFHIRLVTYTAQCTQWLTNCSLPSDWLWSNRSIQKISQQPRDLQNWEEVSTKLSKKRNLSNTGTCSRILSKKKAKSIIWPQQGRLPCMGNGTKKVSFTRLMQSLTLFEKGTTHYRTGFLGLWACFAELIMLWLAKYKPNGTIWSKLLLHNQKYYKLVLFNLKPKL